MPSQDAAFLQTLTYFLIPGLPLLAFICIVAFARRAGEERFAPAFLIAALLGSLALSLKALVAASAAGTPGGRDRLGLRAPAGAQPGRPHRSSLRRHDDHGLRREPARPDLLHRVHEGRAGIWSLLRLHVALLRVHAGAGDLEQRHPDLHLLGAGRALLLSADRLLVPQALRGGRREEGLRGDPVRRPRLLRRGALPLHAPANHVQLRGPAASGGAAPLHRPRLDGNRFTALLRRHG